MCRQPSNIAAPAPNTGKKEAGKTRGVLKENIIFQLPFELLHYYRMRNTFSCTVARAIT
jgi:hypothetical protein